MTKREEAERISQKINKKETTKKLFEKSLF